MFDSRAGRQRAPREPDPRNPGGACGRLCPPTTAPCAHPALHA